MTARALRIRPLKAHPDPASLQAGTLSMLAETEALLASMCPHNEAAWTVARLAIEELHWPVPAAWWGADIRDPLMREVAGEPGSIVWRGYVSAEVAASLRTQAVIAAGLRSGDVDALLEACVVAFSSLGQSLPVRRTGEVISGQPTDTPVLFYPHTRDIRRVLSIGLSGWTGTSGPGLLRAIGLYVFFLNAHPFADGNGRASRLLLNACLRALGMPASAAVPLRWLIDASLGGYKVKIRRVVLFQEWDALIRFICMSVRVTYAVCGRSKKV